MDVMTTSEMVRDALQLVCIAGATFVLLAKVPRRRPPLHLIATISSYAAVYFAGVLSIVGGAAGIAKDRLEPLLLPTSALANLALMCAAIALSTEDLVSKRALQRALVAAVGVAGTAFLTLLSLSAEAIALLDAADAASSAITVTCFGLSVSRALAARGLAWRSSAAAATGVYFAFAQSTWWLSPSSHLVSTVCAVALALLYATIGSERPSSPPPTVANAARS